MEIKKVLSTCSMVELGQVSPFDFKNTTKSELIDEILNGAMVLDVFPKVAMFNCTYSWYNRLVLKLKFGFTCVYSYKGNHCSRVYVMFLKLK